MYKKILQNFYHCYSNAVINWTFLDKFIKQF
jgi:hypothetical protein